ncbi:hypothetical protein ACFPK9_14940 [Rubritalea spongiae]|uniref:Uncharacterized protein n=1 Tax=Rubritalea spongiae TaxID=430797 RepID=A0ABW5E2D2_9BACT
MKLLRIVTILSVLASRVIAEVVIGHWDDDIVLDFIEERAAEQEVEIDEYLIAANLQKSRKEWLIKRLERKRSLYYSKDAEYELLESIGNDGARVAVVAKTRPFDPFYEDVFLIAFCCVNDEWKAAPIPGVFTFTGYGGYQSDLIENLADLEKRAVVVRDAYLRDRQKRRFDQYESQLSEMREDADGLLEADRDDVLRYFIEACKSRDIIRALACVDYGGADDIVRRTLVSAFNSAEQSGMWKTLLDEQFLYTVLPQIEESPIVSLGLYLPYEKRHPQQILEFEFKQEGGAWYLKLPHLLEMSDTGSFSLNVFRASNLHSANQVRLLEVKQRIIEEIPMDQIKHANELIDKFELAVRQQDVKGYLKLIDEQARGEHFELSLWTKFTDENNQKVSRVYEDIGERDTYVIYLVENWPRPERFSLVPVRFKKENEFWSIDPEKYTEKDLEKLLEKERLERYSAFTEASDQHVLKSLLPDAVVLDQDALQAVKEIGVLRELFRDYGRGLGSGAVEQLSKYVAITEDGELSALRAIGADARGRQRDDSSFRWVKAVCSGEIALGIVSLDYGEDSSTEYLFYPFVCVEDRVRLLPSLLYYYEHGRGQALENKKTMRLFEKAKLEGLEKEYFKAIELANTEVERMLLKEKSNE